MSARVDVLAVMDSAKHVAVLCDPLVRSTRHPASNSLEALAFNLRGEIDEARAAVAELIEATTALRARLCLHGDWEDGCFYYNGYSAPELMAPMADVDAALARVKGGAA